MFRNLSDRYAKAKYQNQRGGGEWVFSLSNEINGSRRAIIPVEQQSNIDNPGEHKEVFLLRQTESGNWIATLWKEKNNPWTTNNIPKIGESVEGHITSFNEQGTVAFAALEYRGITLNAKIFPDHLPEFIETYSLRGCLEPGDKISAFVHDIDKTSLQFSLDFEAWYTAQTKQWRLHAAQLHRTNNDAAVATHSLPIPSSSKSKPVDKTLLVVDDDEDLCRDVQAYFSDRGVKVSVSTLTSEKGIQESVYQNIREAPDYILTDFQISNELGVSNEILATIEAYTERMPAVKVAMLSGNSDEAEIYAQEKNLHFFPKPSPLWKIAEWFFGPSAKQAKSRSAPALRSTHSFFAVEDQHKKIIDEAVGLLEKICNKFGFWSAVWVLRNPAGRYEVRASTEKVKGFLDTALVSQFQHSLIEDYITGDRIDTFRIHDNDPLGKVLPENIRFGLAVPIKYEPRFPRCIVFLSKYTIKGVAKDYITDRVDHFSLLVRGISQSEVIDEIAASAQQGRIAFATLHEIRTEIQKISNAAHSNRPEKDRWERIFKNLVEAERLAAGEMSRFKAGQTERIAIGEIITRTATKMQLYLDDKSLSHSPRILFELDERASKIAMPFSIALERTLVNLIDNAADFLRQVTTRYIWIILEYEVDCEKLPIRLIVKDTGPGIAFGELDSVFSPRKSGRTEISTGLGLYISRELIQMLGGTIKSKHKPKWSGAEFEIKLPHLVG